MSNIIFEISNIGKVPAVICVLRLRTELQGKIADGRETADLSRDGWFAAWSIAGTAAVMLAASAFGLDLGLPTFLAAAVAVLVTTQATWHRMTDLAKEVSWSVLPLVAGLFVVVETLYHAGALSAAVEGLRFCSRLPELGGTIAASFGVASLSNVMNNLPSGLLAGSAVQGTKAAPHIRDAVVVAVDLGPNLSITGSLATVLWMIALRREGEQMSAVEFLKIGMIVMPPALLLATIAVRI